MSLFKGSAPALITPFSEDGLKVNFETLKNLIDFQIENNSTAIVILGTTGEASTMTMEEKIEVVEFTVKYVNKRIPVIAGSGSNNTQIAIETSKKFEELGVDALLIVTPYYNKCTQNGLILHYKKIAENVNTPIILYNVPGRTSVNILPQTVKELSKIKNIIAIKEASGNIEQISEISRLCDIDIYSGDDAIVLPVLALGGKGVISVAANVTPALMQDICDQYFKGNIEESRQLQFKVNPLVKALFLEVNPIPVKTAMNLMNFKAGALRLPLSEMENVNLEKLKKEMTLLELI
ncbi:MAG: 4-hydroxy-tetrahydrodipicolinate synthase [Clostridia bacterium]|nr:4-hydroxy-tetrahydrodipicolinate synthase [Clostridia bacterium]